MRHTRRAVVVGGVYCDPDVERLLDQGGWELDDVQARHRQYPDTFWLPDVQDLARLAPAHHVRLIFRLVDQAEPLRDDLTPTADPIT